MPGTSSERLRVSVSRPPSPPTHSLAPVYLPPRRSGPYRDAEAGPYGGRLAVVRFRGCYIGGGVGADWALPGRLAHPSDEPPHRLLVVEDPLHIHAFVRAQDANRDGVLVDVHAKVGHGTLRETGHRPAPFCVGLLLPSGCDPRQHRQGSRPFH